MCERKHAFCAKAYRLLSVVLLCVFFAAALSLAAPTVHALDQPKFSKDKTITPPSGMKLYTIDIRTGGDGTTKTVKMKIVAESGGKQDTFNVNLTDRMDQYGTQSKPFEAGKRSFGCFVLYQDFKITDIELDVDGKDGWLPESIQVSQVASIGPVYTSPDDPTVKLRRTTKAEVVGYATSAHNKLNQPFTKFQNQSAGFQAVGLDQRNTMKAEDPSPYYLLEIKTGPKGTANNLDIGLYGQYPYGEYFMLHHIWLRDSLKDADYPLLEPYTTAYVLFRPHDGVSLESPKISIRSEFGGDDWTPESVRLYKLNASKEMPGQSALPDYINSILGQVQSMTGIDSYPDFRLNDSVGGTSPVAEFSGTLVFNYDSVTTGNNVYTWTSDESFTLDPNATDKRFKATHPNTPYQTTVQKYFAEIYTADNAEAATSDHLMLTVNYKDSSGASSSKIFDVPEALRTGYQYDKSERRKQYKSSEFMKELLNDYPALIRNGRDVFEFQLADCQEITGYKLNKSGDDSWTGRGVAFYSSSRGPADSLRFSYHKDYHAYTYSFDPAKDTPLCYDWPLGQIELRDDGSTYTCTQMTPGQLDFDKLAYGDSTYVVAVTTSGVADSGTTEGLSFRLTYESNDGQTVLSPDWKIQDMYKDFLLIYPDFYTYNHKGAVAEKNTKSELAKDLNTLYQGHTYYAMITLKDVKRFLTFTLTKEGAKDPYQSASFQIYQVSSVGRAKNGDYDMMGNYGIIPNGNRPNVQDSLSRSFDTSKLLVNYTKPILLQGENATKTIKLYADQEQIPEDSKEPSLDDVLKDISFDKITGGLSLSSVRNTYQVKVYVANVPDAGSSNQFFFQLMFAGGTSGVVLANEQITGDAFRQGEASVFRINTNQSYGDLQKVRVICNPSDSTTAFDKANFEKIEVTRLSSATISKSWVIQNIGWIDITYVDEESGASFGSSDREAISQFTSQSGNNLTQHASVELPVSKITGAMNMLFTVTTGTGKDHQTNDDVFMTINYLDTTGSYQNTEEIELRKIMQEFTENGQKAFQQGSVDRFLYSFTDIKQLVSATIRIGDDDKLVITGITVNRVSGGGDVYRADNGQYVRDYEKVEYITKYSPPGGSLTIENSKSTQYVNFDVNQGMDIPMDEATGEYNPEFEIPPPPDVEERFNIYLMPMKETLRDPIVVAMKYNSLYGSMPAQLSQKVNPQTSAMTNGGLMISDLKGVNVGTISGIAISCETARSPGISCVLIQRVGKNAVTNRFEDLKATYYVPFNVYLTNPVYSTPTEEITKEPMSQKVTLTLPDTLAAEDGDSILLSDQNDVQVSIRYTSLLNPDITLQSPYASVYTQGSSVLQAGSSVSVAFDQPYVQNITGVSVRTTNGASIPFANAYLENYSLSQSGKLLLRSTASVAAPFQAGEQYLATADGQSYEERVSPVTFVFQTADNLYAPTLDPIAMRVHYIDAGGAEDTLIVNNIWQYVTGATDSAGNPCDYFTQNSKTTATMMLSNIGTITGIDLNVQALDKWMVQSVTVRRTLPDGSFEEGREEVGKWVEADPLFIDLRPGSLRDESAVYEEKEKEKAQVSSKPEGTEPEPEFESEPEPEPESEPKPQSEPEPEPEESSQPEV